MDGARLLSDAGGESEVEGLGEESADGSEEVEGPSGDREHIL